jgi:hypothetical protein
VFAFLEIEQQTHADHNGDTYNTSNDKPTCFYNATSFFMNMGAMLTCVELSARASATSILGVQQYPKKAASL